MASGNFSNHPVSDFGLYCEWSAIPDVQGNFSTVSLNVYFSYWGPVHISARTDGIINVAGNYSYYPVPAINDESRKYSGYILFASKTVKVNHDSNGDADCYLGASYRIDGTYAGVPIGTITAEQTVRLDHIDRAAPMITGSVANATQNSFLLSASSSVECDLWQYSLDSGAVWNNFTTASGTSVSQTIVGLSPNTEHIVQVRARRAYNHVFGVSSQYRIKTLGAATIHSVGSFVVDDNPASFDLGITVYSTTFSYSLAIASKSSFLLSLSIPPQSSVGAMNISLTLTDEQRETILQALSDLKHDMFLFTLTTLDGTAVIGTSETTALILTTSDNSSPAFDATESLEWSDTNPVTVAVTNNAQIMIQGYSVLSVTAPTAVAKNYASITRYVVAVDDITASSIETEIAFGKVPKSGSMPLKVTAEDSRGYSCETSGEMTVIPYTRIAFDSWEIRRANEVDEITKLVFSGKITPITINNTKRNAIQFARFRYKQGAIDSTEAWSDWTSIAGVSESGNTFSYSDAAFYSFDPDYGYTIEFEIADKIDHDTISVYLRPGRPLVSFRSKKVGINNANPQSPLDVTGNIRMNGYNVMGFTTETGEDTDLDDLLESGIYIQPWTGSENWLMENHCPVNKAGWLEIIGVASGNVLQRYTTLDGSGIYLRCRYNGVWGAWKIISVT